MSAWQRTLTEVDRVRAHTAADVLARLDEDLRDRLGGCAAAGDDAIAARLEELDREWDVERVLVVNAAGLAHAGALGAWWRRQLLVVPLAVTAFLLQHGLQGWCPPLVVFRRRGVRTRREIDLERYALKLLRGDFGRQEVVQVDDLLDRAAHR